MSEQSNDSTTHDALAEFGYRQRLDRGVGQFAAFAAGVSLVSILTGVFLLFGFGYGVAGPGYWWTWLVVFGGQAMVALVFAELAARYPIAGSVYQWTKVVGGRGIGWLAGFLLTVGVTIGCASVALAAQSVMPEISSYFQIIGDGSDARDVSANAVLLGSVLIIVSCVVNSLGVRTLTRINSIGVTIELIAACVLVVLFLVLAERGPSVVLETNGLGAGHKWGYFGALVFAALASAYVIQGFDTASSLAEETRDPRRNAPKAVIRAVVASGVIGGLLILGAMMAVSDLKADQLATANGMSYAVKNVLGDKVGTLMLIFVMIAVTVCLMACMAQANRMIFGMARDRALPAAPLLGRVSPRTSTAAAPNVVVSVLAIAMLLININQPQIIAIVTSLTTALLYLGYLGVTSVVLIRRVQGRWQPESRGQERYYSLGRWGLPVNVIAVLYGLAMIVNLLWPRPELYNPTEPFHWYLRFGGVLFIGLLIVGGMAYYLLAVRNRSGVLAGHEAESISAGDDVQTYSGSAE